MSDWKTLLHASDPGRDAVLDAAEAAAIRRTVVDAARMPSQSSEIWQRPLAVATVILVMLALGLAAGRRLPPARHAVNHDGVPLTASPEQLERRQLRFSTPGGTRIIWTLDPNIQLSGVLP
jgi:sugar/nucleoside kinase (ribokinase family)